MKPTKSDGILVVILLCAAGICLGLLFLWRMDTDDRLVAVITIEDTEYARLPLDTDTTITLPTGHRVAVTGGEVSVLSAPCPDRICVKTPPARATGGSIICLPEKVVITVISVAQEGES